MNEEIVGPVYILGASIATDILILVALGLILYLVWNQIREITAVQTGQDVYIKVIQRLEKQEASLQEQIDALKEKSSGKSSKASKSSK